MAPAARWRGKWISADGERRSAPAAGDHRSSGCRFAAMSEPPVGLRSFLTARFTTIGFARRVNRKGYRFRTSSDTEVLLHLYAEYGPEMCGRLRGCMHLRSGMKPRTGFFWRAIRSESASHYADDGKTLRFASQVKALLAGDRWTHGPIPPSRWVLSVGSVPERSLFSAAFVPEPGSTLQIEENGARTARVFCSIRQILVRRSALSLVPRRSRWVAKTSLRAADSVRHHLVATFR